MNGHSHKIFLAHCLAETLPNAKHTFPGPLSALAFPFRYWLPMCYFAFHFGPMLAIRIYFIPKVLKFDLILP